MKQSIREYFYRQLVYGHNSYIPTFAKTFEIEFNISFCKARTKDIASGLQASSLSNDASPSSCTRHTTFTTFMLRCALIRIYIGNTVLCVFCIIHLDNKGLCSSNGKDVVSFHEVAERYLTNSARLKCDSLAEVFSAATKSA